VDERERRERWEWRDERDERDEQLSSSFSGTLAMIRDTVERAARELPCSWVCTALRNAAGLEKSVFCGLASFWYSANSEGVGLTMFHDCASAYLIKWEKTFIFAPMN
jgi:hypothetical protein